MNPFADKLAQFVEDDVMFNAVKGILLSECDLNSIKAEIPNEQLGEITRAWLQSRDIITNGFKKIEKYRKQKKVEKDNSNPAF